MMTEEDREECRDGDCLNIGIFLINLLFAIVVIFFSYAHTTMTMVSDVIFILA